MKIIRPVQVAQTGSFTRASTGTYYDSAGVLQTAAINEPRFNYDPANLAAGPSLLVEAAATNLVLNSATLVTQSVTVAADSYTLAFDGTGTVNLSGAAVGSVVGLGERTTATVATTAGTLTLTVTGSCTNVQLELGTKATSYIPTAGAAATRAADVNTAALVSNVPETDYSAWSAVSQYIRGDRVMDISVHKVYEALTGERGVATLTVATPGVVSMKDRDSNPYVPAAGTPIKFTTTGALPTGIVAGTTYYVTNPGVASFNVSATVGGANIAFSGTQSGVHTATASLNLNIPVTNKTHWADAGSNNRWSMFDQSITSQTSQANTVIVAFTATERFDSIVGLNLGAASVTINVADPENGITYSTSEVLTSDSGISDMFSYLYEPIVQIGEFLADIPVAISTSSTVTVCFKGAVAAIGGLIFGMSREIGITEWGVRIGTVDYGVKTKDAFGNYTVTQRAFSKRADFTIQVPTSQVDYLQTLLTQYRSVPVVYIGSNTGKTQFKSTIIYGFYKDFSIDIAYDAYSVCSMQIEGLT